MALSDTLLGFTKSAPAPKNRVEILLDRLEGDDLETLQSALRNPAVRPVDLTKALRVEYKDNSVVTDHSVSDWRKKHLTDVNGL